MSRGERDCAVSPWRRRTLLGLWLLAGACVVARSVELQVVEAAEWRGVALSQHKTSAEVAAPRGAILDRDGRELAVSREVFSVAVAPDELDDPDEARRLLREVLSLSASEARRLTDPGRSWHVAPGRYEPAVRSALTGVRGIHLERELRRSYPHGDLARAILGRVREGEGRGGIEQAYDELLRGVPGRRVLARDSRGRLIPGEVFQVEPPVPGGDVRLSIDLDLQEIAEGALADAVEATEARGGDILVTDPVTGDLLAMASFRDGRADALSAINAPFEPGSTLKPFTVAGLLRHRAARLTDTIDTEGGYWMVGGDPLTDIHDYGTVTLAQALRVSSNIALAKAARGFSPAQQYENLRDFGFGVPTGLPLPGEVAGRLRRPEEWTDRSSASLAIGYEVAVTPLQMALAYGALANGGRLMEARLVHEVRTPDGSLVESREPRVVRQVVPREVTRSLGRVLVDVVEDGTGTAARLSTFEVAGKSGTSRAYIPGEGYRKGRYYASFAGFFPAENPQLVIFVKLDSPVGAYYGGATAAPVTRATMEAVLAARRSPIDRSALLSMVRKEPTAPSPTLPGARFASLGVADVSPDPTPPPRPASASPGTGIVAVEIPELEGMPARTAAHRLHRLGFHVRWEGRGTVTELRPRPGTRLPPGDTVTVRSGRTGR